MLHGIKYKNKMLLFDYVNVLEYKGPFYADKSQNRECGGQ